MHLALCEREVFHEYILTLIQEGRGALPPTQALQKFQVVERLTGSLCTLRQGRDVPLLTGADGSVQAL